MTIDPNDFNFTYSGGSGNNDPDDSIGGMPSEFKISGFRLLDDVQETETLNGTTDYRCFYFNNDSANDTIYNAVASFTGNVESMVGIQIGFQFTTDMQIISIPDATAITSGTFDLVYQDVSGTQQVTITLAPYVDETTIATWATEIQNELRSLPNLENVIVSPQFSGDTILFTVEFKGAADYRYHELLQAINIFITPSRPVNTTKEVDGSPINSSAAIIGTENVVPANVSFYTLTSPVLIGDIRPYDVLPVWVKRVVPPNTTAVENDGFIFRLSGSAII